MVKRAYWDSSRLRCLRDINAQSLKIQDLIAAVELFWMTALQTLADARILYVGVGWIQENVACADSLRGGAACLSGLFRQT
jgi:hypothetical protein